jgi:hypothetical protein
MTIHDNLFEYVTLMLVESEVSRKQPRSNKLRCICNLILLPSTA